MEHSKSGFFLWLIGSLLFACTILFEFHPWLSNVGTAVTLKLIALAVIAVSIVLMVDDLRKN